MPSSPQRKVWRIWCVSSVPNPESTTRFVSALPSPSVSFKWTSSVRVGHIGPAVAGFHAGGDQQAVGKDRGGIRLTVAVLVLQDQDLVGGLLARLDLRVDLGRRDPEASTSIKVHLDRLGEQRLIGIKVDLEAGGNLEALAFDLGVGVGDREGGPLREGGGGQEEAGAVECESCEVSEEK